MSPSIEEEAAIALLRRGFSPVPSVLYEKRPALPFSRVFPKTEEEIRRGWVINDVTGKRIPLIWEDGVGIHLGRSNVWLLDIDGPVGRKGLEELTDKYGELPETMTIKSGRVDGGTHYIWDATGLDIRAGDLRECIDIKGNNGHQFEVVPPTVHKSGNRYEYLVYIKPNKAPDWLVDEVMRMHTKREEVTYKSIRTARPSLNITQEYGLDCATIGMPINPSPIPEGYIGLHPFANHPTEHKKNYMVNIHNNTWRCWSCGVTGDAAMLLMIKHGKIQCCKEEIFPGCMATAERMAQLEECLVAEGLIKEQKTPNAPSLLNGRNKVHKILGKYLGGV